eukprot:5358537-Amphidinium_carterae.1
MIGILGKYGLEAGMVTDGPVSGTMGFGAGIKILTCQLSHFRGACTPLLQASHLRGACSLLDKAEVAVGTGGGFI